MFDRSVANRADETRQFALLYLPPIADIDEVEDHRGVLAAKV